MISVIIPIYNSEQYLDLCLASVCSQTYRDIEIICIDDGSTDNSSVICNHWTNKDKRVLYYYQTNKGVSAARNKGIDMATGDYICFVDADDIIHRDFLSVLYSYAKKRETPVCELTRRSDCLGENKDNKTVPLETFIQDIIYERIDHPGFTCFLYDRLIISENCIRFVEGCIWNEDFEFYMKYLAATKYNIAKLDYKGYYYRMNEGSAMGAPISFKTLSGLEASSRVNELLSEKRIIKNGTVILSKSILTYIYLASKQHNNEVYSYLHQHYDVRGAMRKMIFFPKLSKQLVAVTYLLLGKSIFFQLVGRIIKYFL